MFEIKTNQELKIENVLSFRGKIEQSELENIGRNMENKLNELGVKRKGNPVTATFGVEDGRFDVEILLPIDILVMRMSVSIHLKKKSTL